MIKFLLLILILLSNINLNAQLFNKKDLKHIYLTSTCLFLSGTFDGTSETLKFKYNNFKRVFPNCNDNYWNPNISLKNKYKNGNSNLGEKFPLSTTMFVLQQMVIIKQECLKIHSLLLDLVLI